jgi:hypothetical protein
MADNSTQPAESVPPSSASKPTAEGILSVSEPDVSPSITHSKKPPFALRWLSYLLLVPLVGLATGIFGSMNFITNRFTGPGRVGIQSMYLHMPTAE